MKNKVIVLLGAGFLLTATGLFAADASADKLVVSSNKLGLLSIREDLIKKRCQVASEPDDRLEEFVVAAVKEFIPDYTKLFGRTHVRSRSGHHGGQFRMRRIGDVYLELTLKDQTEVINATRRAWYSVVVAVHVDNKKLAGERKE